MINEMISNENLKLNMFETKIYKMVCDKGIEILKDVFEDIDNKIYEKSKENKLLEVHDYTETTVKTIMGDCKFKRRRWYEYKIIKGKKVYVGQRYLLDEVMEIHFYGTYSRNFVGIIIEAFNNCNSYRETSSVIEKITNEIVSYSSVRNIILKLGEELIQKEKEIVKANKEEKLIPEEQREVPMLFGETDGMFVRLQGKDRQKIVENKIKAAKKKFAGDELERKIESIKKGSIKKEIKMACFHEGWKENGKRKSLVNKKYIIGFENPKSLNKKISGIMKNIYKLESVKHLVVNGDGAKWIKKITIDEINDKKLYQKDEYHICKELRTKLGSEVGSMLESLLKQREYKYLIDTLERLEPYYIENNQHNKYKEALKYVSDGLERYDDVIDELPEAPEGTIYKSMGNAESNIYTLFAEKLKSKRKSYSILGALCVAHVTKMKIENKNIIENIKQEVNIDTSVDEWVDNLEKRARKNKYRKEYEGKNNTYEYPIASSIVEAFSDLRLNIGANNVGNYLFS